MSPIKRVADMLSFSVPIRIRALDHLPYSEASIELKSMVRQMKRFGLGRSMFSSLANMDTYEAAVSFVPIASVIPFDPLVACDHAMDLGWIRWRR